MPGSTVTVVEDLPASDEAADKTADAGTETVLDSTVADVADAVAKMTDVHALQRLRAQEKRGKNRVGVIEAIDARIAELKS